MSGRYLIVLSALLGLAGCGAPGSGGTPHHAGTGGPVESTSAPAAEPVPEAPPHEKAASHGVTATHGDHGGGHRDAAADGEHGPLGHRFQQADQWAAHFDDPKRDQWQRPAEVVRLLELRPGMTVADVGAGTGYFLPHLSSAVGETGRVIGIDIEPDMVRYMTERARREGLPNVQARQATPSDPGLGPAAVDRVLIVNTWHHIPERRAYAARLAQALRPGGVVAIVDFTLEAQRGPPRSHRLSPGQVVEELAAGGLLAAAVKDESLPDQYVVIGRVPPS